MDKYVTLDLAHALVLARAAYETRLDTLPVPLSKHRPNLLIWKLQSSFLLHLTGS